MASFRCDIVLEMAMSIEARQSQRVGFMEDAQMVPAPGELLTGPQMLPAVATKETARRLALGWALRAGTSGNSRRLKG